MSEEVSEAVEPMQEVEYLRDKLELMQESMADLILRLEDQGWQQAIGQIASTSSIPLDTVRQTAKTCRSLAIINPLVVRGIAVRTAYIWGNGVSFVPKGSKASLNEAALDKTSKGFFDQSAVKKWIASDQAWQEMEKALSTDGNFFVLATKNKVTARGRRNAKHDIQRIPLDQIEGVITDQDNGEDVWFYKRVWTRTNPDGTSGEMQATWYPAIDYDEDNGTPPSLGGVPVDYSSRIAHRAVGKQTGWRWGVPNLWPVMFWVKAHKEYLETQLAIAKALSRFAFKATAPTAGAAKQAAAKVAQAPGMDPYTGMPNQVGGTFIGAGINLQAMGRPGGAVDFEGGSTLAGYVAAGLSVPLTDLLANGSHSNRSSTETVVESNAKVMQAEQKANKVFFESIFEWLGMDISVKFPPISKELAYRQLQAIGAAGGLHVLSDKEIRALVASAFEDADIDPETLPDIMDMKFQLIAQELAARAGGVVDTLPNQSTTPAGGAPAASGQGAGAKAAQKDLKQTSNPSYGDNQARKDMGQHKYSDGKNG